MALLHLLRHGQHDLGGGVLAGRMPGVGLTERGRAEIAAVAERLAGENIAALYASPLQRTRESAEIVSERLGLPIVFRDDLIELDFGEWTGTTFDAIRADPRWRSWSQHRSLAKIPGGETMRAVQLRVVEAMLEIGEPSPRRGLRGCQPRRRDPLGSRFRARHAARFLRPHRGRPGLAEHDPHRRRRHPRRLDQRTA